MIRVHPSLSALDALRAEIDRDARRLHILHSARLRCTRGCSACCVDDLTVFECEAATIRLRHAELLAEGTPHALGACAFLDADGACRIYADRPYVCRTQGLPLRWIEEPDPTTTAIDPKSVAHGPVELRDICPLNETDVPITSLASEECWTLGPVEDRLAAIQRASDPEQTAASRVSLRSLFATGVERSPR